MPPTILVVEDEPVVCAVVCRMLLDAAYACVWAHNAAGALILLDSLNPPPDLLIFDVMLPDIPGPTLARRVADRWPNLPVLFMSGFPAGAGGEVTVARWEFLPKPFSTVQLLAAVRRLLSPTNATEATEPPTA